MAATAIGAVRKAVMAAGPVLFPHFCLGCGEEGPMLCEVCTETKEAPLRGFLLAGDGMSMHSGQGPSGKAAPTLASPEGPWPECSVPSPVHAARLDGVWSMAPYKDPILRELLQAYKYEGVDEAGEILAGLFTVFLRDRAGELRRRCGSGAVVLPSPLHPFRARMRGFNQADRFAETLAAATGFTVDRTLLRRAYSAKTQVEMGEDERRAENVRGAVTAVRSAPESCILVDDVLTTGSTLGACANALRDAGARRVTAVTVLHG